MNITQKGRQIVSILIFVGAFAFSGQASATTVEWTGAEFFDNEEITFPAFQATSLDSIYDGNFVNFFSATYRDWWKETHFTLDLELDSAWTNIWWYDSPGDNTKHALSSILSGGPINFPQGLVTGIRLGSAPAHWPSNYNWVLDDNNSSHFTDEAVSFTFGNEPLNPVPVPASIWLFGTALIGFIGVSRRRKVA
jgi:hypothetical protein